MSEWISVEERLPKYGQQVLVFDNVEGCFDIWTLDLEEDSCPEGWYSSAGWHRDIDDITHWMPLPSPPGEEVDSVASDK